MIQQVKNINNKELSYRAIDWYDLGLNLFSEKFNESGSKNPCTACGRKTNLTIGVYIGAGGGVIVHPEDYDLAQDGGFMGFFPIGKECIKKVPKEFRVIWEHLSEDKDGWRK
jgi:hypothetical protein